MLICICVYAFVFGACGGQKSIRSYETGGPIPWSWSKCSCGQPDVGAWLSRKRKQDS